MKEAILVINAGSSSIKFSSFVGSDGDFQVQSRGQIEGIGVQPNFVAKNEAGVVLEKKTWENSSEINHEYLMKYLLDWLNANLQGAKIKAAGHRVVHGGSQFASPVLVTDTILAELDKLIPLAPLHQPHNLSAIRALKKAFPDLPQVACFDTAFHRTNPAVLQHFFIPRELEEKEGIKRYGFHGLSYEYIAKSLKTLAPEIAEKRVIVAHLGSGSSMCALNHGKSVSTSMGLTALDGLPMGTRPGNLDAGVVLYLMREKKMNADQIESLLYKKSGLLGLSGVNNDMRILEESTDPRAIETIDAFVWKICQMTGSLAAVIGGMDALVFTAGIGENSPHIRQMVCERLAWMGVDLDPVRNKNRGPRISKDSSQVSAWVIPTNEELMIAQHTLKVIKDH
jgi:acetate kinase